LSPRRSTLAVVFLAAAACTRPAEPTRYLCADGEALEVAFGPRYAELRLPPDRIVRLYPEPAASGAKYGDGRYSLHTEGDEARLERSGKLLLSGCRVGEASPEPDSALSPVRAKHLADSINGLTADSDPMTRQLQPEAPGWEARVLSLWADSGRAIKLTVTEPNDAGVMDGLTEYYFVDGRVEVVRGPVSQYLFRDTTLILWTTDSLQQVAEVPLRDMIARQNFVLGEVRQYLAMFGVDH
jgi:membrane-bound inhibitor of C-type lysozyme